MTVAIAIERDSMAQIGIYGTQAESRRLIRPWRCGVVAVVLFFRLGLPFVLTGLREPAPPYANWAALARAEFEPIDTHAPREPWGGGSSVPR